MKIKPWRNGDITLSFTDVGKYALVAIFNEANISFNTIREIRILTKISEFTVRDRYHFF